MRHTMTSSMQPWLIGDLIDSGAITQSGLSRKAKARECRKCRAWVLAGLDGDVAAMEAIADPHYLTAVGELEALLDERTTYDLEHGRLYRRYHWNIAKRAAGTRHLVLAQHRCQQAMPREWQLPRPERSSQEAEF